MAWKYITRQDVEGRIDILNELMENKHAPFRFMLHKYNSYHVEKYRPTDTYPNLCYNPIVSGSKNECFTFLIAMIEGIDQYTASGL